MEITITETVVTVGWKEGEGNAPQAAVAIARQRAGDGVAVVFGRVREKWVVVAFDPTPAIVWRENDAPKPS